MIVKCLDCGSAVEVDARCATIRGHICIRPSVTVPSYDIVESSVLNDIKGRLTKLEHDVSEAHHRLNVKLEADRKVHSRLMALERILLSNPVKLVEGPPMQGTFRGNLVARRVAIRDWFRNNYPASATFNSDTYADSLIQWLTQ